MTGQCEASYLRGGRCPHAAKHVHHDEAGDRWNLCGIHFRTITRRERRGSAPDLVAQWRETHNPA